MNLQESTAATWTSAISRTQSSVMVWPLYWYGADLWYCCTEINFPLKGLSHSMHLTRDWSAPVWPQRLFILKRCLCVGGFKAASDSVPTRTCEKYGEGLKLFYQLLLKVLFKSIFLYIAQTILCSKCNIVRNVIIKHGKFNLI